MLDHLVGLAGDAPIACNLPFKVDSSSQRGANSFDLVS